MSYHDVAWFPIGETFAAPAGHTVPAPAGHTVPAPAGHVVPGPPGKTIAHPAAGPVIASRAADNTPVHAAAAGVIVRAIA